MSVIRASTGERITPRVPKDFPRTSKTFIHMSTGKKFTLQVPKDLPKTSMIHVSTGKKITLQVPSTTLEVQYPLDWFNAHTGLKPVLSLTLTSANLKASREVVRKSITKNSINIDAAKTFLYYFAETINNKLDVDWVSYGRTIGLKDTMITPLNLLETKVKSAVKNHSGDNTAQEKDDPWMATYILGIYRMIRANNFEYKKAIANRITAQMKSLVSSAPEITNEVEMYLSWVNDKEFNTIVAMFDMYFYKFPISKFSNMRIGTTGSRFRDCAGLMSYGYLMKLLGMSSLVDVLNWVFVEQIGQDIDRMMKEGEELDDQFSYFPYQVDLGLVSKSAYSATANPNFFEWVHLTGTILRSPRSMNARHIHDRQAMNTLLNAACLAYAYRHVNTENGEELKIDESDDDVGEESPAKPKKTINVHEATLACKDPSRWIRMLKLDNNQMPLKVKKYVISVAQSIHDSREGSMDQYLKLIIASLG